MNRTEYLHVFIEHNQVIRERDSVKSTNAHRYKMKRIEKPYPREIQCPHSIRSISLLFSESAGAATRNSSVETRRHCRIRLKCITNAHYEANVRGTPEQGRTASHAIISGTCTN